MAEHLEAPTAVAKAPAVDLVKIPIVLQLDEKTLVDGAVVKPLLFSAYVECINEANRLTEPKTYEARIRRLRLLKQVTYYCNGTVAPIGLMDLSRLSIPSARTLANRIDNDQGTAGKITRPGDGVDKAIVYELGTPIQVPGKSPITELEFSAKTYGDIEDVMVASNAAQQALVLISTLAKPLGTTLMTLPSFAVSQITISDGYQIMRDVLPIFLEPPTESSSA